MQMQQMQMAEQPFIGLFRTTTLKWSNYYLNKEQTWISQVLGVGQDIIHKDRQIEIKTNNKTRTNTIQAICKRSQGFMHSRFPTC